MLHVLFTKYCTNQYVLSFLIKQQKEKKNRDRLTFPPKLGRYAPWPRLKKPYSCPYSQHWIRLGLMSLNGTWFESGSRRLVGRLTSCADAIGDANHPNGSTRGQKKKTTRTSYAQLFALYYNLRNLKIHFNYTVLPHYSKYITEPHIARTAPKTQKEKVIKHL
jgi:hypothetical protein